MKFNSDAEHADLSHKLRNGAYNTEIIKTVNSNVIVSGKKYVDVWLVIEKRRGRSSGRSWISALSSNCMTGDSLHRLFRSADHPK